MVHRRPAAGDGRRWRRLHRRQCGVAPIAGLDSRMDLVKNEDGSVDLYFGPEPPKGLEKNWIPTVPGKGWFAYLRLYAPTESYFDRSWQLPDIEEVAR